MTGKELLSALNGVDEKYILEYDTVCMSDRVVSSSEIPDVGHENYTYSRRHYPRLRSLGIACLLVMFAGIGLSLIKWGTSFTDQPVVDCSTFVTDSLDEVAAVYGDGLLFDKCVLTDKYRYHREAFTVKYTGNELNDKNSWLSITEEIYYSLKFGDKTNGYAVVQLSLKTNGEDKPSVTGGYRKYSWTSIGNTEIGYYKTPEGEYGEVVFEYSGKEYLLYGNDPDLLMETAENMLTEKSSN